MIYRGRHETFTKTQIGSNKYEAHFTDEESSSERFGTWPKLTQVEPDGAWTWTPRSDLESTQTLSASGIAVTLREEPMAERGILRPKGLRGHSENVGADGTPAMSPAMQLQLQAAGT